MLQRMQQILRVRQCSFNARTKVCDGRMHVWYIMLSFINTAKWCKLRPSHSGLKENKSMYGYIIVEAEDERIISQHRSSTAGFVAVIHSCGLINDWRKNIYSYLKSMVLTVTHVLLTFANIRCGRIQCDLGVNIMWLYIIFGDGVDDQLMVRSTQTNPLCFQDRIYPVLKTKWVSTVRV